MSYLFFEDVLEELGHKLQYDAIVNYAGNSFCEKSWDMIMENYPLNNYEAKQSAAQNPMLALLESADVKVIRRSKVNGKEATD